MKKTLSLLMIACLPFLSGYSEDNQMSLEEQVKNLEMGMSLKLRPTKVVYYLESNLKKPKELPVEDSEVSFLFVKKKALILENDPNPDAPYFKIGVSIKKSEHSGSYSEDMALVPDKIGDYFVDHRPPERKLHIMTNFGAKTISFNDWFSDNHISHIRNFKYNIQQGSHTDLVTMSFKMTKDARSVQSIRVTHKEIDVKKNETYQVWDLEGPFKFAK